MGGFGIECGAACARRTSRQQVEVGSAILEGWNEVSTYRLDAETEVSTHRSYPRGPGLWCPERSEGTTKGLEG